MSYPEKADLVIAQPAEQHELSGDIYHFYQAAGHNRDGLIAFHEASGTLITGDYLCGVEFPFIYYSVLAYQKTLALLGRLLNDLPVKTLVAGHGAVTQDKQEMQSRWEESQWYLDALIAHGREGLVFPETELWQKYPHFQHIQRKYHQANLALVKRELGGGI